MSRLEGNEFSLWSSFVYATTRISLDASKGYLIETRLAPLLRETGSNSYKALLDRVMADATGDAQAEGSRRHHHQ